MNHMSLLSLVTGLLKRRTRDLHVLEKCAEPDSGREVVLQEHVLQGLAATLQKQEEPRALGFVSAL